MSNVQKALSGAVVAPVVPFLPDGSLDTVSFDRHLHVLLSKSTVTGVLVNGNAGEVMALTNDERDEVVRRAVKLADPLDKPVFSGIPGNTPREARELIAHARNAGASAYLLYPAPTWGAGRPDGAAEAYVREVASEPDAELILFQFPAGRGDLSYDTATLSRLAAIPGVIAIKNSVWEVARFERDLMAVRQSAPHVKMLTGCDEHVLYTILAGADGAILSLAAMCPDPVAKMLIAARENNLKNARAAHQSVWPIVERLFVAAPKAQRRVRIKAALVGLGQIEHASVRPPLTNLAPAELQDITRFMKQDALSSAVCKA
ncbi:MAG: dihydrodipicolinate synthase family protein [Betaproteobacteria bacterium]|nr:dihydrodipicolinate synthase family protein [Betaproteobacteria bacterium]